MGRMRLTMAGRRLYGIGHAGAWLASPADRGAGPHGAAAGTCPGEDREDMQGPSRFRLEIRHLWAKLSGRRARAQARAKVAFKQALAGLTAADVAIDLGANAGEFTRPMAETGAQVYAFEPDPHALKMLEKSVAAFANVTIVPAAAGTADGTAQLYRSTRFAREPDRRSKSSSLLPQKRNVSVAASVQIETRDLIAFLTGLDQDIALIKMDIEGAEVALMEALLAAPVAARIGDIFIETHERALPHLAARTEALRSAGNGRIAGRLNWDWH